MFRSLVIVLERKHSDCTCDCDPITADAGVQRKAVRYPLAVMPNAKLVAFSVETWGRWAPDAVDFLRRAAGRAAQRSPGLASLEEGGSNAVYAAWLRQLSCALQKANVACLRGAAAGGARNGGAGSPEGEEEDDWLAEQVDDLLREAAASVGVIL